MAPVDLRWHGLRYGSGALGAILVAEPGVAVGRSCGITHSHGRSTIVRVLYVLREGVLANQNAFTERLQDGAPPASLGSVPPLDRFAEANCGATLTKALLDGKLGKSISA